MRILVCPDSFKGTLTSPQAADAIARGWKQSRPADDITQLPLADGGDGTASVLAHTLGGKLRDVSVPGPLLQRVTAQWADLADGTAMIEMAAASGLTLINDPADRDPEKTTTRGTGTLIRAALDAGHRTLRIGIGGSATNDGGAGMLQELGVQFLDQHANLINDPITGGRLADIASIDLSRLDPRLSESTIEVACDVDNPLLGPQGATRVFGPQKGASPEAIERLEGNIAHLLDIATRTGIDPAIANQPGAGAAGGMGWALMAFCGARLTSGIGMVLDAIDFDTRLAETDLVITGEGQADAQTLRGKVVAGVRDRAVKAEVPVILIAGTIDSELRDSSVPGIAAMHAVVDVAESKEAAMEQPAHWLEKAAALAATQWPNHGKHSS